MADASFKLTPKQIEAQGLIAKFAQHILLYGGSRSAKTFLIVYALVFRALAASYSRHAMLRFRFNAIKTSIINDTFPKVMRLAFPEIEYRLDKSDFFYHFPNGSQIWCGGLDDKDRTEKILGMEFASIFLGECSQIPLASRDIAITRLAQNVIVDHTGRPLRRKMFYDENPPNKAHWTYRIFIEKVDPETRRPLPDPDNYASLLMNPADNTDNLPSDYISTTLASMNSRMRKRFERGEFADANPHALFGEESIDRWRVEDTDDLPDMVRIAVAVDPSGADEDENKNNDAIGIVAVGLGTDGNAYVLEDNTVKAGPATWGKVSVDTYHRLQADVMAAEINYGGAMVKFVIKTADPNITVIMLSASRGKVVRAEPFSALFEQGKVRIVGRMIELEDELMGFSTFGYVGDKSPNRADAMIWALSVLFPAIVSPRKEPNKVSRPPARASGWMS